MFVETNIFRAYTVKDIGIAPQPGCADDADAEFHEKAW